MDFVSSSYDLNIADGGVKYISQFLSEKEANAYLNNFESNIQWRSDKIKFFGKEYDIPRLQAWYGDKDSIYSYSNIDLKPLPWTAELLELKSKISDIANEEFNSVLLNLYRDGRDSNGWHSDDEKELGPNPTIASLSLGQERVFHLKHKTRQLKETLKLENGSLLIMKDETQKHWKHQIPKSARTMKPRINLTFRRIFP